MKNYRGVCSFLFTFLIICYNTSADGVDESKIILNEDGNFANEPNKYFDNSFVKPPSFRTIDSIINNPLMKDLARQLVESDLAVMELAAQMSKDPYFNATKGQLFDKQHFASTIKHITQNEHFGMMMDHINNALLHDLSMIQTLDNLMHSIEDNPFMLCVDIDDAEGLKDIMSYPGINKNTKDLEGKTALHHATTYGEIESAKVLIEAGVEVDALDNNKNTPLHYAAGNGCKDCVEILMDKGGIVTRQNADGMTPVDVAKLHDQHEVLKLLEKDGFV